MVDRKPRPSLPELETTARRTPPDAATPAAAVCDALALRGLRGVGAARFRALVDHFGSPGAALSAGTPEFAALAGKTADDARRGSLAATSASARETAQRSADTGMTLLVYGAPGYPERLGDLPDPPPVLFALGDRQLLDLPCVAVVGSRRATLYGRRVARRLGSALAAGGRCVVSGMAMGVDAEAHRGALPGPTTAVLASGADMPSPPRNAGLYREIAEHGLILSEHGPGVRAEPHHFPVRNRIIAALAQEVVVVEASKRSGALITAGQALDLGRDVRAVPGPIDRPTSEGTNLLIADGAELVLGLKPEDALGAPPNLPNEPELRRLLLAVPAHPVTVEEAAQAAGLSAEAAAASATMLELRGYLTSTRDGLLTRA